MAEKLCEMAGNSGGGGSLKSTTTWADAVANAKSYIVAYVPFNDSYDRAITIFIPKSELTTSIRYFLGGGAVNVNNTWVVQCGATTTSMAIDVIVNGAAPQSTGTPVYYYD